MDLPVLESIAVEETGDLAVLADPYTVMQVAQECAAGAVDLLRSELTGTRERNLLKLAKLTLTYSASGRKPGPIVPEPLG